MAERLLLIDAHPQCYQAFYAVPDLSAPDGRSVNAVYGFTATLIRLLRELDPAYAAVCFDAPGPTRRHAVFPAYKVQRKPMPADLVSQIPLAEEVLAALGIPAFKVPGYEADDLLGALARQAEREGLEVVVATTDKDAEQILSPKVRVFHGRDGTYLTPEDLFREKGIRPEQVPDYLALTGDQSDGIPGVPGVGPKSARELLQKYGSVEGILAAAGGLEDKRLRERLLANAATARMARGLATIDEKAPVAFDREACRRRALDRRRVLSLFLDLGFRKFLDDLQVKGEEPTDLDYRLVDEPAKLRGLAERLRASGRFAVDLETTGPAPLSCRIVGLAFADRPREAFYVPLRGPIGARTLPEAEALNVLRPILEDASLKKVGQNLKYDELVLRNHGVRLAGLTFDTMIAGHLLQPEGLGLGLGDLALKYLGLALMPIEDLIGKGRPQGTLDLAPVDRVLRHAGEEADFGLRLSDLLLDELRAKDLLRLFEETEMALVPILAGMEWAGIALDPAVLRGIGKEVDAELARLEGEIVRQAGGPFNLNSPRQLSEVLFERLKLPPLRRIKTGFSTDAAVLEELAERHDVPRLILEHRQFAKLKSTYIEALPRMVNPRTGRIHASFHQTVAATGRLSSSDPNLQNIPVRTPLGRRIREAFVPRTFDFGSRISDFGFGTSDLGMAATPARAAAGPSSPLLRPRGSPGAETRDPKSEIPFSSPRAEIRNPKSEIPERVFLSADYSQIELRILAHLSGDAGLRAAFETGLDIHRAVAAEILGVPADQVKPEDRDRAKAVNFGIIYGQSAFGLSKQTGVKVEEAERFIGAYFARYPGVEAFMAKTLREGAEREYVATILGRRRYVGGLVQGATRPRTAPERAAFNAVVQGSAADLIKLAMLRIDARLGAGSCGFWVVGSGKREAGGGPSGSPASTSGCQPRTQNPEPRTSAPSATLLLQIHDELLFEVDEDEADALGRLVKAEMEGAMALTVPLVVNVAVGKNWGELK